MTSQASNCTTSPTRRPALLIRGGIATLLIIAAVVGSGQYAAADNEKIWYVNAAKPDDSGDGHTPATAKKTMTAALSASVEGDTFYIMPGVYSSTSSLNPKNGQHWIGSGWGTVLQKTTGGIFGSATVVLTATSGVTIENLKVENTASAGQGVYAFTCDSCNLRRVWADAPLDGAILLGFNNGHIEQCQATARYDAWVINGRCTTVENTVGITEGQGSTPIGCFRTTTSSRDQQVVYMNCQSYCSRTTSNAFPAVGWEIAGDGIVLLTGCTANIRSTATDEAGQMQGVSAKGASVGVVSGNCAITTANAGGGGAVDLVQAGSAALQADPSTCKFDMTSGTIVVRLPNFPPGSSGGVTVVP